MRRSLVYFLCASPLLAQTFRPTPRQAPIDALIQSYQSALNNGKYDEAVAKREQARAFFGQIPVNDPQFANWAQRVSQLYDGGGFALQARDVLEQALARSAGLGESSPVRIAIRGAIATSWEQDRNLLQSVSYLEQAVMAAESEPKAEQTATAQPSASVFIVMGTISAVRPAGRYLGNDNGWLYQRLFNLYRTLGRPQDAAAVLARVAAHVKNSDGLLASLYQQQGQIDEAAAIYKRQAAEASVPQQAANAWQSLANLYQGAQRYADAAAAMQQAIGATEASGFPGNSLWMRQSLASILQQAGQVEAADQIYQRLMTDPANQQSGIVTSYANYLEQTSRAGQAETLLKNYLENHASAAPAEQDNLLWALVHVEQLSGKTQLAAEYQSRVSTNQAQVPAAPVDAMQRASDALNAGRLDEGFNLTLQALDSAHGPPDIQRAYWNAQALALQRAPVKADEIYRRTMALAESWSAATVSPLLSAQQNYAEALRNQQRWSEFDQAVECYSATLISARGAGTGWVEDSLRLRAGNLNSGRLPDALAASQEMVQLEESLSGDTSEPYLRAIETLANAMEANEDPAGALPLRRKVVTLADLVYTGSNDSRRATVRIDAAMTYARSGQFDEAEALAREAVAMSANMHSAQSAFATSSLQQILQMRQAAQAVSAARQ